MAAITSPLHFPPQDASNYDEASMQQSLPFFESLKDLKNLKSQLYSAAEYFELSYINDDQKQLVVETLKDYAVKALVNTVDHLGSVTFRVNDLLREKVDEVSGSEVRVSCIEQRIRTCQAYTDHEGRAQQSLVINTPKHHKRYIFPVGETLNVANCNKPKHQGCSLDDEDEWHHFRDAVRATIKEDPPPSSPPSARKGRSPSPSPRLPHQSETFSFTSAMPKNEPEKRSASPHRFPLLRSGSAITRPSSRQTTPTSTRSTTPNLFAGGRRYPSEPRKSSSMHLQSERDRPKEIEQYPSKSKRLLKALLSRRKSKKDDTLYKYLDEY